MRYHFIRIKAREPPSVIIREETEIANLYEKWKTHQVELNQFYKNNSTTDIPKLSENEAFTLPTIAGQTQFSLLIV